MSEVSNNHIAAVAPPASPPVVHRSVDRNIVLFTVERANDGVPHITYFGVRESTIRRMSVHFENIFSLDQGPFMQASATYDGLRAIEMVQDDPADVEAYLAAHHTGYLDSVIESRSHPVHGLLDVPAIHYGVLRLADKYVATDTFMHVVTKPFCEIWPSHLSKWIERTHRLRTRAYSEFQPADAFLDEGALSWDQTALYPNPVPMYVFALKHEILHALLPVLACDIGSTFQRDPDSLEDFVGGDGSYRYLKWSPLGEYDQKELQEGCRVMHLDCARKLDFEVFVDQRIQAAPHRCRYSTNGTIDGYELPCISGLDRFWTRRVYSVLNSPTWSIDLLQLPTELTADTFPEGACASCAFAMINHIRDAQYVIWVKLPIYFRLFGLVPAEWGFGPDRVKRIAMLPKIWRTEVTEILERGPGEGQTIYDQLRNGAPR
ncbi:unnamed protein product [Peniophora sp. CBMAI 1063]|nr:unnamed protein product [Peniophora sp. CBMAI 1063]